MEYPRDSAADPAGRGRARLALEGLSIGDAFGERFFGPPERIADKLAKREMPRAPWFWTDDTAMGLSVYEVLVEHGHIDPDALAIRFAERYHRDPMRGYGGTAHTILQAIFAGMPWRVVAQAAFDGEGSQGNGGAMRAAPVGGYFADDLEVVVRNALESAAPTHAHVEGRAGAVAVAVAAALAWQMGNDLRAPSGLELLRETQARTPPGPTRDGLARAVELSLSAAPGEAAALLGNGSRVIASDTVPYSIWCAARHLQDYEEALWTAVSGLGDRDTTCAIVGGIVALSVGYAGIPAAFAGAREPLDSTLAYDERHASRGI